MSGVSRDEKSVATATALAVCVLCYVVGALLLAGLGSLLHFSDDVSVALSVLLLIGSAMAALVIMLRDRSRRT